MVRNAIGAAYVYHVEVDIRTTTTDSLVLLAGGG